MHIESYRAKIKDLFGECIKLVHTQIESSTICDVVDDSFIVSFQFTTKKFNQGKSIYFLQFCLAGNCMLSVSLCKDCPVLVLHGHPGVQDLG